MGSPSVPLQWPAAAQEELFFLGTSEQKQSWTDALLLFCIDISGSMSITSQASKHRKSKLLNLFWLEPC